MPQKGGGANCAPCVLCASALNSFLSISRRRPHAKAPRRKGGDSPPAFSEKHRNHAKVHFFLYVKFLPSSVVRVRVEPDILYPHAAAFKECVT